MNHTRIFRLLALMMSFALLFTACEAITGEEIPEQPSVVMRVGDETYEEPVYSYCWPEAAEDLTCEITAGQLTQPSQIAELATGQEVRFQIVGDASQPSTVTATVLDGQGGAQDLGVSTEPSYTADLPPGLYRLQVDVQYDDIAGHQAFVSYVFGLNVGGQAVAAAPTPAETAEVAPPLVTAEPVLEPVPAVTEAVEVPLPTAAPTEEIAALEALAPTEEPAPATVDVTDAALLAAPTLPESREDLATAELSAVITAQVPDALATEEATAPPVEVTLAATAEPTEEKPVELATLEALPTAEAEAAVEALPLGELTVETAEAAPMPLTTVELTEEPTEEADSLPTVIALVTLPATEEPATTVEATAEALGTELPLVTAEATPEAIMEALEPTMLAAPTQEVFPAATKPVVTLEATEAALLEATVDVTAEVTAEATTVIPEPLATAEATLEATEAAGLTTPTLAAPQRPTRTPSPPGAPDADATLPFPTPLGTEAAELEVPLLTLTYAGMGYLPVGYRYCETMPSEQRVCVNVPTSEVEPQRIWFLRGLTAELDINGPQPSSVTIEYRSEQGEATGTPETRDEELPFTLLITPERGYYILVIEVAWEELGQDATYFFRVSVAD